VAHHFQPTSLQGAFLRLGSVQYDPLQPVGRNHDLVLQARVADYKVGDWEKLAYQQRFLYDGWDKQASLVLMQDYPVRRIYYTWHAPRWRKAILDRYPQAVATVVKELRERGPLSSTEFHFQEHHNHWEGTWYGPKLTKNILRALWHTGRIHTCRRDRGKHVYDLAEKVVPSDLFQVKPIPGQESIDWLIRLRHRALGLMRPNAGSAVWSLDIPAQERRQHLKNMVQRGDLVAVEVEGKIFHTLPKTLELLDDKVEPQQQMRFIAPLDQLMWDRPAVAHLFDFDYVWEVYKPEKLRRWGYYVLPVMLDGRFVGRIDSRLSEGTWHVHHWYWEDGVEITTALLEALEQAVGRFRHYLRAHALKLPRAMDGQTRNAFRSGFKGCGSNVLL